MWELVHSNTLRGALRILEITHVFLPGPLPPTYEQIGLCFEGSGSCFEFQEQIPDVLAEDVS